MTRVRGVQILSGGLTFFVRWGTVPLLAHYLAAPLGGVRHNEMPDETRQPKWEMERVFGRKAKDLRDALTDSDTESSIQALRDALHAETSERIGSDSQGMQYRIAPDHKMRVIAAKAILEFRHGKAVQRGEMSIHADGPGPTLSRGDIIRELASDMAPVLDVLRSYGADAIPAETVEDKPLPELPE